MRGELPALYTGDICSVIFTPDGRGLIYNSDYQQIITKWNLITGRPVWRIEAPSNCEYDPLEPLPDGRHFIVPGFDTDNTEPITIRDIDGRLCAELNQTDPYSELAFRLDATKRFLVFLGYRYLPDQNYRPFEDVWSTTSWRLTGRKFGKELKVCPNYLPSMPKLSTSGRILSGQPVVDTSVPIPNDPSHLDPLLSTHTPLERFADSGRFRIEVSDDESTGRVSVWNMRLHKNAWAVNERRGAPLTAAVSKDGRELAVAGWDNAVQFYDVRTGRLVARTPCATDVLRCATYSPNGRVLAVAGGWENSTDGIILIDASTHKVLAAMKAEQRADGVVNKRRLRWYVLAGDGSYYGSPRIDRLDNYRKRRPDLIRAALKMCWTSSMSR